MSRSSSRAPSISRSSTPGPSHSGVGYHRSPSKLTIPPALRQSPSLSNLRVHSYNAGTTTTDTNADDVPPVPPIPPILPKMMTMETQSSASSVINLELDNINGNRILVQDVEAEVDSIDEDAYQNKPSDESKQWESKKMLRDQLRRTLTSNHATAESSFRNRNTTTHWLPDSRRSFSSKLSPREYFILTDAGKPVFISRGIETDDRDISSMLGVMQALISVFIDDGDKLKSINAGKTRITFLQRQPLYYACVSAWGEPESVSRSQLEYLHLQIISVVTSAQLKRIFERRGNFDLRRLLGGADTFLTTMIARLQLDLAISMSALRCLRLDPLLRNKLAQALVPSGQITKDILYVILVTQGEIITLIRPKKHSVHPADIHILLTTLASPSLSNSPASAMWIPLCLPKWNETRMVNAYVVNMPYMHGGDLTSSVGENRSTSMTRPSSPVTEHQDHKDSPNSVDNDKDGAGTTEATMASKKRDDMRSLNLNSHSVTLVCISGGSDFDSVRAWCDEASEKLSASLSSSSLTSDTTSVLPSSSSTATAAASTTSSSSTPSTSNNGQHPHLKTTPSSSLHHLRTHISHSSYTVSELGIPGLRHFVYKARGLVQVTYPLWEDDLYGDIDEGKSLVEQEDANKERKERKEGQQGDNEERKRIITLYQLVHDAIHAKGMTNLAQGEVGEGLKLQYLRTETEAVLGWITQPFEIYLTLSPLLPKSAAVGAANAVARWVKKEESKLFLKNAPVF
ncbi:trafficking protein Mon1-domain-containing protein [Lentinula boryana]|uniref:Vacuolar fusion protein MON1 n=1 Tax=Lentinula boryana TaxID=40481 RepID=A0ABQ8QRN3_9AGAR|nr:trafficking protein Mon1-domain-containing protein [Lentinula boryana]